MERATYVPLWCKSNFSFLHGASHPEELVERAYALGLPAVAITDRDGVYGVVRAFARARELGMKLIVGADIEVVFNATDGAGEGEAICRCVLLVRDREGWRHLCQLLTLGHRRTAKQGARLAMRDLTTMATAHGEASGLVTIIAEPGDAEPTQLTRLATALREGLGEHVYMGLSRHWRERDVERETRQRAAATAAGLACVALPEVLYHDQARRPLQDVLTCIARGVTLTQATPHLRANAEHHLAAPAAMAAQWRDDLPSLARTLALAELCTFSLGELRYRYPSETLPSGLTSMQWLRELTERGARWRYGDAVPPAVFAQLARELAIVEQLDYAGYFLTMYEIVQFCNARGILCQGRGSAANSVVCYTLGITAIDPIKMDLLFERFLSVERAEPPDIDLDIEHARREEVIAHMYAHYGRDRAAMVCNVVRYRGRSAWREVGKAFGLSQEALGRGAAFVSSYGGVAQTDELARELQPLSPAARAQLLALCQQLEGMPRHLSIHPGGFLLGHEPVCDLVPIENATMPGRTVIQWDKNDIETLGLFKVDLLALGALTQLQACFALLRQTRDVALTMATLPPDDADTFDMLCTADTVGVFQIESRAQMSMLPRLRPRNFYDLVVQISLVRPGPIAGGMVHPYLRRRRGQEATTYPHPSLRPVLAKTLGVPLFQEQVMRLAMVAADYTPGEADQLRRDMAAWKQHGHMDAHRERLITRMVAKGIAPEFAERVFMQIRGFGEYGFPESHAASFALIAYATSYLRRHYLPEFVCTLLNAQPMGFYSPATIVQDTKRHGVDVRPIDVNLSEVDCAIERGEAGAFAIRLGLRYVKGLSRAAAVRIVRQRAAGTYPTVATLMQRAQLTLGDGKALAEASAFASMNGIARRDAMWQVRGWARQQGDAINVSTTQAPTFDTPSPLDDLLWDYEATGLSSKRHPLAACRKTLRHQGLIAASDVAGRPHGARVRYFGQVICRQRPGTASGVTFMTLEDETGFVNLVIWKHVGERYRAAVEAASLLYVVGTLQAQEGVVHLIAEELACASLPTADTNSTTNGDVFVSRNFY